MVSCLTYLHQKLVATFIRFVMALRSGGLWKEIAATPKIFPGIKKEVLTIPSRDPGRSIKAHLYYSSPTPRAAATIQAGPKPVLVNWHGSGFVFTKMFGSDAYFCSKVASETGIYVLDADYRKAPENRWPAAVHDVEDVLNWIATQPGRFDSKRVATSGFSAGGNLALIAAGAMRKSLKVNIEAVAAVYPATDLSIPNANKVVPNPLNEPPPGTLDCRLREFPVKHILTLETCVSL